MMGAISRLNVTGASGEAWARTLGGCRRVIKIARASPTPASKHTRFIPGPRYSIPRWLLLLRTAGGQREQLESRLPVHGSWEQSERGRTIRRDCQCGRGKPERLWH